MIQMVFYSLALKSNLSMLRFSLSGMRLPCFALTFHQIKEIELIATFLTTRN